MQNELIKNLHNIHTTELGITRVKKNLELKTNDVINWCINEINNDTDMIYLKMDFNN